MKGIKNIIKTDSWQVVEKMLKEELIEKAINIKTEGKTADVIALEVMAMERASKIVNNFLKKLKRIASMEELKEQSYK